MELDAAGGGALHSGSVIMHVNKVHSVITIGRVAKDLSEDENWLWDVANGMDTADGVIWVYGIGDDQVMAFTDFGIENLMDSSGYTKQIPNTPQAMNSPIDLPAA